MGKAYYLLVRTEDEKRILTEEYELRQKSEDDVCKVYIDVVNNDGYSLSRYKGYKALYQACRRGTVDTVLLEFDRLYGISELYALNVMLRFKAKDIRVLIRIGEEEISNTLEEYELLDYFYNFYGDYLMSWSDKCKGKNVYMQYFRDTIFLVCPEDLTEAQKRFTYISDGDINKKSWKDVVFNAADNKRTIFLFRPDWGKWYYVNSWGVNVLKDAIIYCGDDS